MPDLKYCSHVALIWSHVVVETGLLFNLIYTFLISDIQKFLKLLTVFLSPDHDSCFLMHCGKTFSFQLGFELTPTG